MVSNGYSYPDEAFALSLEPQRLSTLLLYYLINVSYKVCYKHTKIIRGYSDHNHITAHLLSSLN